MNATIENWIRSAEGFTSDSRASTAKTIFVALKGESRDGAEFVPSLLAESRALGAVVPKDFLEAHPELEKFRDRLVEVANPATAHREIAAAFRRKFGGRVVGVGGSNGKTSTKEFLRQLLAEELRVVATDKSQNGELGIPRTLEKLRADVEVAVVEIGIDGPGEMTRHATLVHPDTVVLTSIGEEHLNLLKTIENVFREECLLIEHCLSHGGRAFVPEADPWLVKLRGKPGVTLVASSPEKLDPRWRTNLDHPMARQNAALACAVAQSVGVSAEAIARRVAKLEVPEGRGARFEMGAACTVLADHYNANVSSVTAALEYGAALARDLERPFHCVLGDMLDLGNATEVSHDKVLTLVERLGVQNLVLIGPELRRAAAKRPRLPASTRYFEDSASAAAALRREELDPGVVLLKGSRGMKLERILEKL